MATKNKRSLENAGTVEDYIDAIYSNNPKEEFLGEPEHHYDFTQSEEWANAHGYYPDKRGHRDDRVKKPAHPSHPSRGIWEGNNFILTNKGLADPNYIFFGLNDGGQDPQAILKYKDTYVIPEFTVTPKGNYINNSYDNIRLHFKNGGIHYKIKKGDSLSKIAQQYTGNALRYNELAKLNGIENPDKIEIGQNIVIPKQFLDTIKDTNLQEIVVTGDKNKLKNKLENRNRLQNELDSKLKALTKRHVETPSTLRVQRIHNRSRSLEELNKPNFIERKIQDVKDVINESGNISDFFQTAWNGVSKNFVEDKKVTTKKRDIKINNNSSNNKIKDNTVLDENFAKEIRNGTDTLTWDRVPMDKTGNKYYIQESYPITKNMRFGARNRGDYTPLNSNNAPLTTYRPLVKYENNKTGAVDGEGHENHFYGFDKEGKFKVGPLSEFGPGDTMTQAFYFDVVKVKRDKSGNIVYKEDRNNPGRFQPVVEGYDENTYDKDGKLQRGKYKESTITTMSKKRSLDGSYGNVSGGRVLLKADNETRIVSGSIDHVIQELELMQKNHKGKPVRYYQLDNGSYNRGLRTRNGKNISEQDLRDYDKQNTTAAGGGHFMYIRK